MRIACVVPYSTSSPGVRSRVLPLMTNLAKKGHDVVLATMYRSQERSIQSTENSEDSLESVAPRLVIRSGPLVLAASVSDWVRRFDTVYILKQCLGSCQFGWALAKVSRAPILLDIDDYVSCGSVREALLMKRIWIRVLPNVARKIVVASRELQQLYDPSGENKKVIYLPNSVDLSLFNPPDFKERHSLPVLVWPGDLNDYHLCELILNAFARMNNRAKLHIIGQGRMSTALQDLSRKLCIQNKVNFLGPVSHSEIPGFLARADVGLIPLGGSFHDRCKSPIKLCEYMAMELPIVTVDFGEASTIVRGVGCGLTARCDPDSFGRAMDEVVDKLDHWREMGKRGRQHLIAHQNWELLSKRLEQIFLSMTR